MTPSTVLRPVTEWELDALSKMDYEIFGRLAYPRFVLRQLFDVFRQEIFVAADANKGTLHGYSIAVPTRTPGLACFLALGVAASYRGRGLGRRLVTNAIDHLRELQMERVHLTVEPHNTIAISLYKSLGFADHGRVEDYYGPGETRLSFELNLGAAAALGTDPSAVRVG